MSWLANNYEKAALGATALCALGLAYAGWNALNRVEEEFVNNIRGSGKKDTAVAGADRVTKAIASLGIQRQWTGAEIDGRSVNLFVSVPLFVTPDNPGRPIDLLKDEQPVHPPIPNVWWLDNLIDPGFQDSPARDPDADGFTNLEEFNGSTDPNDPKAHPPLIAKLKFIGEESVTWAIRPDYPNADGSNTFRYLDNLPPRGRQNATSMDTPVKPGDTIFEAEPAAGRFKFLGHEKRKFFNDRTATEEEITFARIQDLKPNKAETIYEFPAPLSMGAVQKHQQFDRTAVFTLEAIGRSGQEFKVEEFTTFTLPHDVKGPAFKLLSVNADEAVVEFTESGGTTRSVTIPKGSIPQM
jgi:hypothetical protein